MLGLKVNAGAGGLVCQQRKEDVKNTGQAAWITQLTGSGQHLLQTPKLSLTRAFLASCLWPRASRPPECGQGVSPFSRCWASRCIKGTEPPSLEWAPKTQGSILSDRRHGIRLAHLDKRLSWDLLTMAGPPTQAADGILPSFLSCFLVPMLLSYKPTRPRTWAQYHHLPFQAFSTAHRLRAWPGLSPHSPNLFLVLSVPSSPTWR